MGVMEGMKERNTVQPKKNNIFMDMIEAKWRLKRGVENENIEPEQVKSEEKTKRKGSRINFVVIN